MIYIIESPHHTVPLEIFRTDSKDLMQPIICGFYCLL